MTPLSCASSRISRSAQGPKVRDSDVELRPACLPAPGWPDEGEDSVALLPEALGLEMKLVEHLRLVSKEPKYGLTTPDRSLADPAV